jgi:hypothetical protein
MCWESTRPSKPSEDSTDYGEEPVLDPEEETSTDTDEEPTGPCEEWNFGPEEIVERIDETIVVPPCPGYEAYDAWNLTTWWYAKFSVDISRQDCAITVTVRLRVTGTITQDQLDAWEKAIKDKWNNKVRILCHDPACPGACPAGYLVYINVLYDESNEHFEVIAQTPDATSDGISGLNGTTGMTGWGVEDLVDITHEFGHMLGNPEEYFITNGIDYTNGCTDLGFRDPNGGIMNNPANDPLPNNYSLIAEKVASLMGLGVTATIEPI